MTDRMLDVFCASIGRSKRLAGMVASVRDSGVPARVLVGAGDLETVRACESLGAGVECIYSTQANRRIGCTAALNLVFRELVRPGHDALFCTDDVEFEPGCLRRALDSLDAHFPDGDGVVGLAQSNIPGGFDLAFPLMGRAFLERFRPGDLFFPGYLHMFNDAELAITIKAWGRWRFEPEARLRHFHPCHGGEYDETFAKGRTHRAADEQLWAQRRAAGLMWAVEKFPEIRPARTRGAGALARA